MEPRDDTTVTARGGLFTYRPNPGGNGLMLEPIDRAAKRYRLTVSPNSYMPLFLHLALPVGFVVEIWGTGYRIVEGGLGRVTQSPAGGGAEFVYVVEEVPNTP